MQSTNNKVIQLAKMETCTGCSACADVCPKACITFQQKGIFYHPAINDDECVKCGKCMKACPEVTKEEKEFSFHQQYFYSTNVDVEEMKLSSSGGVGAALARYALERGYYVCGACFDEKWHLHHEVSNHTSILEKIRGTKYLQSDVFGVYRRINDLLDKGQKVLFFGTPCQVEGLQRVIPNPKQKEIITCAIICHGVPSPVVWERYVDYLQKHLKSKLTHYNFRSKSRGWGKVFIDYSFENGKSFTVPHWKNLFHTWFGKDHSLRTCCLHCPYRIEQRYSDITIGDFWGIEKILPQENTRLGASVLIVSSEKGYSFCEENKYLNLKKVNEQKTKAVLKGYIDRQPEEKKIAALKEQRQFEEDFMSMPFHQFVKVYPAQTIIQRGVASIKVRIKRILKLR